jgi:ribosomal protein L17
VIVYVETNFVLELALLQEEHSSCEKILKLCEARKAQLVIPAYSLVEPFEKLGRSSAKRKALQDELDREVAQIGRTKAYAQDAKKLKKLADSLLRASTDMDRKNLEKVRTRIFDVADVIPLDAELLRSARKFEKRLSFASSQDAIVYASVVLHLDKSKPTMSCFLSKDTDFRTPDVRVDLEQRHCKPLFSFDDGYQRIRASRRR